jgi:hypothetical protein
MSLVATISASSTRVFIDPPSLTVGAVGDSFIANVSISNVTNLYAYQFELYYNSTVMNGTQVIEGSFLESGGPVYFNVVNFTDHYDSTQGLITVFCTLTGNVSGVSGWGVLTTIKFKSLALADSAGLHLADVELYDRYLSSIPNEDVDATVTVVPEFTSLVAFLTLIAASLLAVLVRKRPIGSARLAKR